MKSLLLIFILYINYSVSQSFEGTTKKIIIRSFPKKVSPGFKTFYKAGTYIKHIPYSDAETTKKEEENDKAYTAFGKPFPKADRDDLQIVPDSPYFPVSAPALEQKRVKKVLPEYLPLLSPRFKRFADDKDSNDKRLKVPPIKRVKQSANSKDRAQRAKNPPTHKSKNVDVKRSKTVKLSNKNDTQVKKLKGSKAGTLRRPRISKKKRDLSNHTRTNARNVKKQNLSPLSGRSKKLKSKKSNKRMPDRGETSQKKLKSAQVSRSGKKLKSVRNNPKNKLSQVQSNRTSNPKAVRNSKGPDGRRLIAARDALIEEYPYVVSFQKDEKHWCSGALLNPRLTITTANCLWRSNSISKMRVRAGSRHTDRGGQVAKIQEVMKHPGWKLRTSPDNDIALVLLDRNIRFSHACHGVDLPNRIMMPAFDDAWITSWGSERRDGIYDIRGMNLQVYHARLIERDKCNNVTQRFGVSVTENFICLAQTGRRAPCTRDTGAPAVSDGVLWGLASWGIRKLCGTERFPAMFSYLASRTNMDFIINATHYLMADERYYPFGDRYPLARVSLTTPPPITLPY